MHALETMQTVYTVDNYNFVNRHCITAYTCLRLQAGYDQIVADEASFSWY
jgi:hypothetical protein